MTDFTETINLEDFMGEEATANMEMQTGQAAPLPPQPADPNKKPKFYRYKMTELLDMPMPKWLLRGMILEQQIAVFCSASGSFKSYICIGLAGMMAHEMQWMGRNLKRRRSIYLAGEGFPLMGQRRMAWFKYHGLEYADDGVEVVDGTVNLLDDEAVNAFIGSAQDALDTDLLFIDTLSTSLAGEDENGPIMAKAVSNAQRIGRALQCAVLVIHHPGKDEERGFRGHSSLGANVDAGWLGKRIKMKVKIKTIKQRDAEDDRVFWFEAHKVKLGIFDDEGVEVESIAMDVCDPPTDEEEAEGDLFLITQAMKLDNPTSVTALAKLVKDKMDCEDRTAMTRINSAVPTSWTRCWRNGKQVEIIRVLPEEQGKRKPVRIEMRLAVG
jgi:hypothetical protein